MLNRLAGMFVLSCVPYTLAAGQITTRLAYASCSFSEGRLTPGGPAQTFSCAEASWNQPVPSAPAVITAASANFFVDSSGFSLLAPAGQTVPYPGSSLNYLSMLSLDFKLGTPDTITTSNVTFNLDPFTTAFWSDHIQFSYNQTATFGQSLLQPLSTVQQSVDGLATYTNGPTSLSYSLTGASILYPGYQQYTFSGIQPSSAYLLLSETFVSNVPEPGSFLLLGIGLLGAAAKFARTQAGCTRQVM